MTIKTFRGLIADGAQDTVVLHTNNGSTGYRITKLLGMSNAPGTTQEYHIIKIYKISQTAVDGVVDMSDNTLIAALCFNNRNDELHSNESLIIADNEIFNQDIYITHTDVQSNTSANFYLELEQVKLDLNENTVATLKDIRNIANQ